MRFRLLWALAAASGAVGSLVLYDSIPGVNWTGWVVLAIAGLIAFRRPDPATLRAMALPLGFAILLAAGASVTTTEVLLVAIGALVAALMALAVIIASERAVTRPITAPWI